jgi:hypothetical protein
MRYSEFVIENFQLDEEISLTQYEPVITKAIYASIKDALIRFAQDYDRTKFHTFDFDREEFNQGYMTKLGNVFTEELKQYITAMLIQQLEDVGIKIEPHLRQVDFPSSKGSQGSAGYNKIKLNANLVVELSKVVYQSLYDLTLSGNFGGEGELLSAFWDSVRYTIKNWNSESKRIRNIEDSIYKIVDVFIHELVHIKQHAKQAKRKGNNDYGGRTEFRSYLDKKKDEFSNLANKHWTGGDYDSDLLSPEEKQRYHQLYYASPAEISAHAHNIASKIIKSFDFANTDDYTRANYIENAQIALRDITSYLDEYLHSRFKGSTDKRTQMVYKRYHKLVYQELYARLQQYIKSANFHP